MGAIQATDLAGCDFSDTKLVTKCATPTSSGVAGPLPAIVVSRAVDRVHCARGLGGPWDRGCLKLLTMASSQFSFKLHAAFKLAPERSWDYALRGFVAESHRREQEAVNELCFGHSPGNRR